MTGMDTRAARELRRLVARIGRLERQMRAQARASQARHRSVEGGSFTVYDEDGVLRSVLGATGDGAYTWRDHNGPTPPQPEAPTVRPIPGGLLVRWSGLFEDDNNAAPEDYRHVEVHASQTAGYAATDDTQRATMPSVKGGTAALSLDPGTWFVSLVVVSTSGKESDKSLEAVGFPIGQNAVKAYEDQLDVVAPAAEHSLTLTYVPIDHSEHLYWNGEYQPAAEWTRDGYVVTIPDPDGDVEAGDQLVVEYLYVDGTPAWEPPPLPTPDVILELGLRGPYMVRTAVTDTYPVTAPDVMCDGDSSTGFTVDTYCPEPEVFLNGITGTLEGPVPAVDLTGAAFYVRWSGDPEGVAGIGFNTPGVGASCSWNGEPPVMTSIGLLYPLNGGGPIINAMNGYGSNGTVTISNPDRNAHTAYFASECYAIAIVPGTELP